MIIFIQDKRIKPWCLSKLDSCVIQSCPKIKTHPNNIRNTIDTYQTSVYYLSRLKWKMPQNVFAERIERKVHFFIISFNLAFYFTALWLDVFNTSAFGTVCYTARRPTGCQVAPEVFGECDAAMTGKVFFFNTFNSLVSPLFCIAGCVGCICSEYIYI